MPSVSPTKDATKSIASSLVGESLSTSVLRDHVRRLAPFRTPILLTGEPGVGKEHVARVIHAASPRRHRTFRVVECAALTGGLLEGALFGRATENYVPTSVGALESAMGGTVYLRHVEALPLRVQATLATAIESESSAGGRRRVSMDARVLAGTGDALAARVKDGRFDPRLYHLLSHSTLTIAPLRERLSDLEALAEFFVGRVCREFDRPSIVLSAEQIALLKARSWPENVGELERTIVKAFLFGDGEALDTRVLEGHEVSLSIPLPEEIENLERVSTHDRERARFREALVRCGGNYCATGTALGVSESTARRRAERYGLSLGPRPKGRPRVASQATRHN